MLGQTVESSLGFIALSFLTWSVTFAVLVFGVILRRKVLLWNEQWKEMVENTGMSMEDFADDLQRTFEKVRSTYRLLGFFLVVLLVLLGSVVYMAFLQKPFLTVPNTANGLWLLILIAISAVMPAFVNFGIGVYIVETMLLKANEFVFEKTREDMKEKKAKIRLAERTKEAKEKRQAAIAKARAAAAAAAAGGAQGAAQ
jgi:hypothetical protein